MQKYLKTSIDSRLNPKDAQKNLFLSEKLPYLKEFLNYYNTFLTLKFSNHNNCLPVSKFSGGRSLTILYTLLRILRN